MPGQRFDNLRIVLFKYHIVKGVAMGGVIIGMVIFSFRVLIAGMMVLMLDGTVSGNGVQQGFGVVMMRHQVVSQEC